MAKPVSNRPKRKKRRKPARITVAGLARQLAGLQARVDALMALYEPPVRQVDEDEGEPVEVVVKEARPKRTNGQAGTATRIATPAPRRTRTLFDIEIE